MMSDMAPVASPSSSTAATAARLAAQLPFDLASASAPHSEPQHEETLPVALSEPQHNSPATEASGESPSILTSWPVPTSPSQPSSPPVQHPPEHLPNLRKQSAKSQHQPDVSNHDNARAGSEKLSNHARPSREAHANTSEIVPTPLVIEPQSPPRPEKHAVSETEPNQIHPHLLRKTSHMESDYVHMVLALDDISIFYNIAAGFFTWILLAGFVLFPGTFPNLQAKAEQHKLPVSSPIVLDAVTRVTSLPLFIVAWACTGFGILGMLWLTWRWRKNYIWALNKIFIPGLLNSLAGMLSTLASIYGSQDGEFTRPSRITLIVLVSCSGVCLILVAIYALWFVRRMKDKHDKEVGLERAGKYGEGVTVGVSAARREKNKVKEKQQV